MQYIIPFEHFGRELLGPFDQRTVDNGSGGRLYALLRSLLGRLEPRTASATRFGGRLGRRLSRGLCGGRFGRRGLPGTVSGDGLYQFALLLGHDILQAQGLGDFTQFGKAFPFQRFQILHKVTCKILNDDCTRAGARRSEFACKDNALFWISKQNAPSGTLWADIQAIRAARRAKKNRLTAQNATRSVG